VAAIASGENRQKSGERAISRGENAIETAYRRESINRASAYQQCYEKNGGGIGVAAAK
jgi:hypothetical protein